MCRLVSTPSIVNLSKRRLGSVLPRFAPEVSPNLTHYLPQITSRRALLEPLEVLLLHPAT
jgi:hypothetical protein